MNGKTCSKCGEADSGPGGILCRPCRQAIESAPLYPLLPDEPAASETEVSAAPWSGGD